MAVEIHDDAAIAILAAATTAIELRAPDGRVLGKFVPIQPTSNTSYPEFGMTDEELYSRENDPNVQWLAADDVIKRLRSLRKEA